MTICLPPQWTPDELEQDSIISSVRFGQERLVVADTWAFHHRSALQKFERLLEILNNLDLHRITNDLLVEVYLQGLGEALRYVAGPPISDDDLRVITGVDSLVPGVIRKNPDIARKVFDFIETVIDPFRFPWVGTEKPPTEEQKSAALLASATLLATQRVATERRMEGNDEQETRLKTYLRDHGLTHFPTLKLGSDLTGLQPMQFGTGCLVGERKADVVIGLADGRLLVIDCKMSNSATNSVKRLNNDAAVKAEYWLKEFGPVRVVPAVVLSGVFKVGNLEQAQRRGLALFWGHNLEKLGAFITATKID